MMSRLIEKFDNTVNSRYYWLLYIVVGFLFLTTALIYQYYLNYEPCIICIQIRLLVTVWILLSIIGLFVVRRRIFSVMTHLSMIVIAIIFVDRSYLLLGTERGFIFGDCGFDLGMPAWFAIEEWLPFLFRIETSCGYTPEIILGITMAEILMVFSVLFLLLSFTATLFVLFKRRD